jgi:hypothetical protein
MGIALAQITEQTHSGDPLLTAEDVAERLKLGTARSFLSHRITMVSLPG